MMTKPILLVEDEESDVFLFQRALNKAGVISPVQVARDGQQAIDYLNGAGKFANRLEFPLPGLILLDLKLPFVMGLDVLKWIRQQSGLAPIVIILSSSHEEEDIVAGYLLGANAYLVKPAEVSKLQDMVRAINDFWLTQSTPPPDSLVDRGPETLANPHTPGPAGHRWASARGSLAQACSKSSWSDI